MLCKSQNDKFYLFTENDASMHGFRVRAPNALELPNGTCALADSSELSRGRDALAVARLDATQQSLFFSRISSHPWTKATAGWILYTFD